MSPLLPTFLALLLLGNAATLPQGRAEVAFDVRYLDTRSFFIGRNVIEGVAPGTVVEYADGGELHLFTIAGKVWYGVSEEVDIGVDLPLHAARFQTAAQDARDIRIGDVVFGIKYRWLERPFLLSSILTVKAPTGSLAIPKDILPLAEGQWDLAISEAIGTRFDLLPLALDATVGYRHRYAREETGVKPGDEVFYEVETLLALGRTIGLSAAWRGFEGTPYEIVLPKEGISLGARRSRHVFVPGLRLSPRVGIVLLLEAEIPWRGEEEPAGISWGGKLLFRFPVW